jgi:hypothetical protein
MERRIITVQHVGKERERKRCCEVIIEYFLNEISRGYIM